MDDQQRWHLLESCLDRHYEEILNFMYLRLGNRADAEDITQETFLAAVKSIEGYKQEATLRTWIFAIARRTLADAYARKSKGRRLLERLKRQFSFQSVSGDHMENTELFSLLDLLNEAERELVILKHYFGFSYNEIAEMTGLSSSNVGVKLSRTIEKLRSFDEGGKNHEPV
ncbi:MAG TPA: sigma-70 family RNA polymerase sigma factor [Bacillales bacterium]|nr:sigma-70 family RNA polymerase sigma factor [Bacillales bacterium]